LYSVNMFNHRLWLGLIRLLTVTVAVGCAVVRAGPAAGPLILASKRWSA
jgi:hypothetical protein